MQVTYTLSAHNMLSLQTRVTNTGTTSMPLNDGWHPYFTLGPSVNDLAVQFNSHTMLEFDNRLLPTGNFLRYEKFETLNAFGDTALDNCFLLRDFTAPSCILRDENTRLQLTIRADPSYPYLQVYSPPHRKSIAIENLSSAPDSFNNHMGLVIVKPGEQITFATSYQMQSL
jgi:aldose 1-epimerase